MRTNKTVERLVREARNDARRDIVDLLRRLPPESLVVLDGSSVTACTFETLVVLGDHVAVVNNTFRGVSIDDARVETLTTKDRT